MGRWVSGGRGKRESLLVVTNSKLETVAAVLSTDGDFVLACRTDVAERAMSLFTFSALVLDEDVTTFHCSAIARAFARQPLPAPILHCWQGYPGGVVALIAEHAAEPTRPHWRPRRRRARWSRRSPAGRN
jgi:hypothetical protein